MSNLLFKPSLTRPSLQIEEVAAPSPADNDVLITTTAVALNHRDLFIRQHLYPGTTFHVPLLSDGVGIVSSTGAAAASWKSKRVILTPGRNWASDPAGPEAGAAYGILGGTKTCPIGTAQEVICVDASEVEEAPVHLSDVEAAALPLTGLTAWRALVTKSGAFAAGTNVLVTGIGGGVALNVLQFAVAKGVNVYVSSGSEEKIRKAVAMGARGGVNYKSEGWEKELLKSLPEERPALDAIVDGAGGEVIAKATRLLKVGGVVVSYGMTISPKMDWLMGAVLKNIELRGSTMGSRDEFRQMVRFVGETGIKPVVSRVVQGLESLEDIDGLFEDMKSGSQFGKLVIEVAKGEPSPSKL